MRKLDLPFISTECFRLWLVETLLDSLELEVNAAIQSKRLTAARKRRDDIQNRYFSGDVL